LFDIFTTNAQDRKVAIAGAFTITHINKEENYNGEDFLKSFNEINRPLFRKVESMRAYYNKLERVIKEKQDLTQVHKRMYEEMIERILARVFIEGYKIGLYISSGSVERSLKKMCLDRKLHVS
jgi:hypothetical protein